MLSYVAKHSKLRKTTKSIKLQWIASIWRQNDLKCWVTSQTIQNNAKLQKWSKNNDLHRFDVKTIKATQISKRDQIPMNLHRFDVQMIKNVELRRKPFKTAKLQKWSNWTSKRAKMMSYVENHSILRKTTKSIKLQWIASIWRPNDQNVELRRKPFKTAKLQKWSNWTSKRSKMLSYFANHSKPLNYKRDQIGRQNEQKWWVTSQNIQNYVKLRNRSNYNDLHRFDVQTFKNVE